MATITEQSLIRNLYPRLRDLAEDGLTNPVETAYQIELDKERNHRLHAPDDWRPRNFSAKDAAKYFTLKFVFEGLTSDLTADDILNRSLTALYGQAIARKYRAAIMNEFTQVEIVQFSTLNYTKLIE